MQRWRGPRVPTRSRVCDPLGRKAVSRRFLASRGAGISRGLSSLPNLQRGKLGLWAWP